MTNLDSVWKSRDIASKGPCSQGYGLPSGHVSCESWTVKKAERWRIDAFKPWCWRRLLRVSWTARRSKQSLLREINPEYSLEGLMLKRKLQYFGHLMWTFIWSSDVNSWVPGKVPDAGKDWGLEKRVSEDEMAGWHHRCSGHELGQTSGNGEGQGGLMCCHPSGCKESDVTGQLNNNNNNNNNNISKAWFQWFQTLASSHM